MAVKQYFDGTYDSVWDAIKDDPHDAFVMKWRSGLMTAVKDEVRSWKVTQHEAAERLDITDDRLNDLLSGKISKFSLDALVKLAARGGVWIEDPNV
ncbi:MAG: XRE family transcriptional regulator [Mycobacterium sp.]|nr:XRE family transcriptional regulator [Mycobacterium sp.]